mmetsp:Transcript_62848/g.205187  ORF Transcript_62848/g.205187 Transcript_62848/m.205187 type:complete len:277 (+) Transcript_62848:1455-2285(+)
MMHPRTLAVAISWAMFGSGSPMRKATRKLLAQFARHPSPSTRSAAWTVTESTSSTCAGVGSTTSMRTCALRHWCTRLRIMQARVTSRMTATQCSKSLRHSSSTTRPTTTTSRRTSHMVLGGVPTARVPVVGPSAPSLATPGLALARPSPACATIRRMGRRSASSVHRLAVLALVHPKALSLHLTRARCPLRRLLLRPRLHPRAGPRLRPLRHQRLRPPQPRGLRPQLHPHVHRHRCLHLPPRLHLARITVSTRTRLATSAQIGRDGVAQAIGTVTS